MHVMNITGVAIALLYGSVGTSFADPMIGDPAAGLEYARAVCTDCHVVEPAQTNAVFIHSLSFEQIAADARFTAIGLRAFLQTPHDLMPDYILTREQTDDLVAYILSLKPVLQE